jgi:cytochrome oxidase Cu insertion factor (SCO1/SenC/PrrC family)
MKQKPFINPWTIWVPIIMMALGIVIYYNYVVIQGVAQKSDRPPFLTQLRDDLSLTERSGKEVKLSQLAGKVLLVAHFYSTCPSGCSVIVDEMKTLYDKYSASYPELHMLSVAIDPGDTPERLAEAAKAHEITAENWWFVTGDQPTLRAYLNQKMKFLPVVEKPVAQRTSPVDKYTHDMRIALIDREGHLRGMYEVMNEDPQFRQFAKDRLVKNLEWVLSHKEKP